MSHLEDATTDTGPRRSVDSPAPRARTAPVARVGRAAVELAARATCGDAVVASPAIADGLALAGRRAAVVLLDREQELIGRPHGPWVLHRIAGRGEDGGFAVELAARTLQEAVDHVVVAQVLAARTGQPVSCSLPDELAARIDRVELPAVEPSSGALAAGATGDEQMTEETIAAAFDDASRLLGRPLSGRARIAGAEERSVGWDGARHAFVDDDADAGDRRAFDGEPCALALGAVPGGPAAERFLLDLAGSVAPDTELAIAGRSVSRDVAAVTLRAGDGSPPDELDVLVVGHPTWLRRADVLGSVREGATVLVLNVPDGAGSALERLPDAVRQRLQARRVVLRSSAADGRDRLEVVGAVLGAAEPLRRLTGDRDPVDLAARALPDEHAARLARGRDGIRTMELTTTTPSEQRFTQADRGPREPARPAVDETEATAWRDRIRKWHAGFPMDDGVASSWPATVPTPAAVVALLADPASRRHGGPMILFDGDDGLEGRSLRCWLRDALGARLSEFPILSEQLDLLAVAASRAVAHGGPSRFEDRFDDLTELVRRGLDVSDQGARARDAELERLRGLAPPDAVLLRTDDGAPLEAYVHAVRADRTRRRDAYRDEIDRLRSRLRELLAIEEGHAAATAEQIGGSVGDVASAFLDTEKLSSNIGPRRGPKPLAPRRRARIETSLATLDRAASTGFTHGIVIVHDGGLVRSPMPDDILAVEHPRPLDAAAGIHDGLAQAAVDLFRAVRTARLDVDDAYDEDVHDAPLARFDARRLTAEETYTLPTVAVVLRPERIPDGGMTELSGLLRSGRPVHVLVPTDPLAVDEGAAFATHATGLGYLAAAHREAFVLESTLARPRHLVRGLRRMVSVLRPGAAVVAVPPPDERHDGRHLTAALNGRAAVCFRYDAGSGVTWADRFDLDGNPQPERPWPRFELAYVDSEGDERTRSSAVTWADAVALASGRRRDFLVIPPTAWSDSQVEVAEWLALADSERRRHVPYIWVVDDDGLLARAIVSRRIAEEALDRVRAWRTLQELAGTDNEHARRAADAARSEALAEAEALREALVEEKDAELEQARTTAAAEAMDRLVQSLMNLDAMPPARAPRAPATTEPSVGDETVGADGAAAEPSETVVEEIEEEEFLEEPSIDSVLCTSCQECININPQLFRYDGNKQAFVADPNAGTFQDLVRAAEKCPARCIHPGAPRSGDATVTDELVARAAKFN